MVNGFKCKLQNIICQLDKEDMLYLNDPLLGKFGMLHSDDIFPED